MDPDDMLFSEWVEIAWSKLLDAVPTMANPFEYQKKLHDYFWVGSFEEDEVEMKPVSATEAVASAQEAIGGAIPMDSWSEFQATMERARAMQAAEEGTE